jgi:hypothetical protein
VKDELEPDDQDEPWGNRHEVIAWVVAILAPMFFGLWAMKHFPMTSDGSVGPVLLGSYACSCALVYLARRIVFTEGDGDADAPRSYKVFMGALVAFPLSAGFFGAFLIANDLAGWGY